MTGAGPGGRAGLEFAEQELTGGLAEGNLGGQTAVSGYDGQRGGLVVVGDHGQVVGDAEAALHGSFDQARGVLVGVDQDGAGAEGFALGQEGVELRERGRVVAGRAGARAAR